jgi:hypothetical protein
MKHEIVRRHSEPRRRVMAEIAWADIDVEEPITVAAMKVVVMGQASEFITSTGVAGQIHRTDFALFVHRPQVTVDGRNAEARHHQLGEVEHFLRAKRPRGVGERIDNGAALLSAALLPRRVHNWIVHPIHRIGLGTTAGPRVEVACQA